MKFNTVAKRISRLVGAFALASMIGCASDLSVSSLTSAERQKVAEMVVLKAGAIPRAGYQILGSVEGLSCKYYRHSNSPTMDEAMQDVRIRAAKLEADAVTNMVCEHQGDGGRRNCWEAVVCKADAINVTDKSMLSPLNQRGETHTYGTGGSKSGTENASSPEQIQRKDNDAAIGAAQQLNAAVVRALADQMARNQGYSPSPIVGGQVLSPSGNTQSKQRQPVENMNRCKQIRVIKGGSYDVWELFNNCPVPVSVAWCEKAGCKSPISTSEIPAGSKYKAGILGQTTPEPGAVLYCPANSFNTTNGGVWACWPKN